MSLDTDGRRAVLAVFHIINGGCGMVRTRRPVLSMVLTALVLVLTPRLVLAQTGSISGVVRDSSGACCRA